MRRFRDMFDHFFKKDTRVSDVLEKPAKAAFPLDWSSFGLDFFRAVWDSNPGQNVLVSPFSVASMLAVLFGGAGGETREAIARTLRLGAIPVNELDQTYKNMLAWWRSLFRGGEVELLVANSLWTGKEFPIRKDFSERIRASYDAETGELDFAGNPAAVAKAINSWVSEKTKARIPSIVGNIPRETGLMLANAVYFKGQWAKSIVFDRKITRKENFQLLDGSSKSVPMMCWDEEKDLPYHRGEGFQAVILPYGNSTLRMILFLPDERDGLVRFMKRLKVGNWARWISECHEASGRVYLPRFRLECGLSLNNALSNLGMEIAFGPQANFGRISSEPVWIGEALHRAFLDVDEKGSEAAAATVGIVILGFREVGFLMKFDHPFFCAIQDEKTGAILFAAAVVDP